ncbi:MAG TPA: RNA pseudouridine synthase, partial [Beijerinckiaceae bacterium]|nr:RNA pseudouridine synthase [Beijerinckiaceae bacterium]
MRIADPGDREGKAAITRYRVLAAGDGLSLVQFEPQTGRTHQIRVHSAALGCPIAGDVLYGGDRARALARQLQLHARQIVLPSREGVAAVTVTAPLPDHMRALVGLIGLDPDAILVEPKA